MELKNIYKLFVSGVFSQIFAFVLIILITKLYSPEIWGQWLFIYSVIFVASTIGSLRFDIAIVQSSSKKESSILVLIAFISTLIISIPAIFLITYIGKSISDVNFIDCLTLLIFSLTLTLFSTIIGIWSSYKRFLEIGIIQSLFTVFPLFTIVVITNLINVANLHTIIYSMTITQTLITYYMIKRTNFILNYFNYFEINQIISILKKYKKYIIYNTPSAIINTVRDRLIQLMLGNFLGYKVLAFVGMSQRFCNAPNSLITSAIKPVYYQYSINSSKTELRKQTNLYMQNIAYLTIPFLLFIWVNSDQITLIVFGENWIGLGTYLRIFLIPILPLILGNWQINFFDTRKIQGISFKIEMIGSITVILSTLFFGFIFGFNLIPLILSINLAVYYFYWLISLQYYKSFTSKNFTRIILISSLIFCISNFLQLSFPLLIYGMNITSILIVPILIFINSKFINIKNV